MRDERPLGDQGQAAEDEVSAAANVPRQSSRLPAAICLHVSPLAIGIADN